MSDDGVRRVLARKLNPVTTDTVVDPATLRAQLARVRKAGYAVSFGERPEGAVGIAAPILDTVGVAAGSVQLTIPKHRFKPELLARFAHAVTETGELISAASQSLPHHD
jgi:DNA-binding IclR family transcriptional regulator